jgi:DNA-binding transcriptional regulator YiaG
MSNIVMALKAEIVRLSRKEVKAAVIPLKKANAKLRQSNAALRERMEALENALARAQALSRGVAVPAGSAETDTKARITGKGIRSLRKRLGVSGEQLGKLLGVSLNAVYSMEKNAGALRLRKSTRAAVLGIRNLGAREAKARLAELKAPAKKAGKK